MGDNFQDNVSYGASTLAVSGDAIAIGNSTSAGAKSIIFNNSNSAGYLVWQPNANATMSFPAGGGTVQTVGQGLAAVYDGANSITTGTIRFSNANGVSFGINGQTITASAAGGGVALSAGANSTSTGTVVFSNSNNITFGMNGAGIVTASFNANNTASTFVLGISTQGNTSGTTGFANQSVQLVGSNGVTLSQSINGNSATITVSGFLGTTLSTYEPYPIANSNTAVLSANIGTSGFASFFPFVLPQYVNAGWLNLAQSMSFITVGNSSGRQSLKISYGLYSRGTGTNSTTLGTITSNSYGLSITANNSSYTINQPTSTDSAGYTTNTTASAGSNITSGYTGGKLIQLPIGSTLTPGNYWLGLFVANSTSSINCGISNSFIGWQLATVMAELAPIGSFSVSFNSGTNFVGGLGGPWHNGLGSFSSAGQTNLPGTVAYSALSQNSTSASLLSIIPYMKFANT